MKVREALRGKVMVVVDERDQREIDKLAGDEDEPTGVAKRVEISRHVSMHSEPISLAEEQTGTSQNSRQLSGRRSSSVSSLRYIGQR
jgi:hypothetical protein